MTRQGSGAVSLIACNRSSFYQEIGASNGGENVFPHKPPKSIKRPIRATGQGNRTHAWSLCVSDSQ